MHHGNDDTPRPPAPADRRTPQEVKLARRRAAARGLFAPDLLKAALEQAFVMLRPDIQWKNPVMFVVEVGTVLTLRLHDRQAVLRLPSQAVGRLPGRSWTSGCS